MKKYLTPFQDIKFNIYLFLSLAVAAVMGTLIPQVPESPEKVQAFLAGHPHLGFVFQRLSFFKIYYSWWFVSLLGLMAFDVVVCKLIFGKFPGLRTFKKRELTGEVVETQTHKSRFLAAHAPEMISERLREFFRKNRFYTSAKKLKDGSILIYSAKHRPQRYGTWVSHVSILMILLANLTGAVWGFKEILNIPEGTSAKMENRPWVVACDDFKVEWYQGTDTPKTFASSLRLFEKGNLARESQVIVNEPLEYKRVRFYQANYGPFLKEARVGLFLRTRPRQSPPAVTLKPDEETPVPGTPYSLRILDFVPDFFLDQNQKIGSRSPNPQNPAIQILVSKNGKPLKAPWIFEKFPTIQMPPAQASDEFIPILAEAVSGYYTGLQVAYDPGADMFWVGCAILVGGLMTLFYLHHRKVWVLVKKEGAKSSVRIGAFSSRGKSFESEFLRLVEGLKTAAE